jgi:hypothetical protein
LPTAVDDDVWFTGDNVMLDFLRKKYAETSRGIARLDNSKQLYSMSQQPPSVRSQSSTSSVVAEIMLDEMMAPNKDYQFLNRQLTVIVVAEPVQMTALHMIVEDSRRDAVVVALYNAPRRRLPIGAVLQIRDPYRRICQDRTTQIRIDNPATLTVSAAVLDLCWNCLTEYKNVAELHRCGRCKWARYCSRGCQTTHWKEFDHKNNCKVPSGD